MQLKNLMVDSKSAWVEFPGLKGFEVEVVNLSRKELTGMRKKCITTKFDRKTRQVEEILDEERFVTEFSKKSIKSWKGLKLSYLETILLVQIEEGKEDELLPFSQDNAEQLVSNSNEFDTWLNEVVFDLDNFRGKSKRRSDSKAGETVQKS